MMQLFLVAALAQNYYPMDEGSTWTYESTFGEKKKESVKKIAGKEKVGDVECVVVQDDGMGGDFRKLCVKADKDGVVVHQMRKPITAPFPWLKFPLEKGVKWTHVLASPERDEKADVEFVVGGEEEIVVPAGTFKARSVKMTGKEQTRGQTIELTMWYAADVGEVKRTVKLTKGERVEEGVSVLVKYTKGN